LVTKRLILTAPRGGPIWRTSLNEEASGLRIELIPREPGAISLGVGSTLLALSEGGAPIIAIPAGVLLSFRVQFSRN
ncbi:hypothetical protein ACPXCX_53580, partial [Streptomyces sp. DT225]